MNFAFKEKPLTQAGLNATYAKLARARGLLPVKVTPFYQKKIDEEFAALGHMGGPLARVVYPSEERLNLHAPHEIKDWVGDGAHTPEDFGGTLIHKYPDRVLFTPSADCAAHCLYCFRGDFLTEQKRDGQNALEVKLARLLEYLTAHPSVREVILSGGDPLALPFASLEKIYRALTRVPTVEIIRIHSRAPVFSPAVLKDENKIRLFASRDTRFVFHVVHPYEVCDEVAAVMERLHAAGVRLYNQFPFLRKTNDHADVLLALLKRLDACHVQTLSIFAPEPVPYSAAARIGWDRMCRMIDEVTAKAPPWLVNFRFCLDTPLGKLRRENIIARDRENGKIYFGFEGKKIAYPDFPESIDEPGDIATLLWRG